MHERMERDEKQADAAREKYGNLAEHAAFRYTKGNERRDMTSDRAIARVYRKLEQLPQVMRVLLRPCRHHKLIHTTVGRRDG